MAFTVSDIVEKEDSRIDIDLHRGQMVDLIGKKDFESAAQLLTALTDYNTVSGPPLDWIFDEATHLLLGDEVKWTADHHTVVNLAAGKLGIPQP